MRAVIQRVSRAEVTVGTESVGRIGRGLLILLGLEENDDESKATRLAKKVAELRIFENEAAKFDLSLKDIDGEALVVSQFTLCASCEKGRRPDFLAAAQPFVAKRLYEVFMAALSALGVRVAAGRFGASMKVSLENDGPATFILE